MTVLVDDPRWPAHGRLWAHLASDTSLAELHAFAEALGLPRRAFEGDHYDVAADLVPRALARGAVAVPTRELLRRVRAAGLRTPKRRGERVVATREADGVREDLLSAAAVPAPHGPGVVLDPARGLVAPLAAPDPALEVLGFRRRWWWDGGLRRVEHHAVQLAAGGPGNGPLPAGWWSPLWRGPTTPAGLTAPGAP